MHAQSGKKIISLIYKVEADKSSKAGREPLKLCQAFKLIEFSFVTLHCRWRHFHLSHWYRLGTSSQEHFINPDISIKMCAVFHSRVINQWVLLTEESFPHLFLLFSEALWYLTTSFWSPGETACILWRTSQKQRCISFYPIYTMLTYWYLKLVFFRCSPLAWSLSSWLAVFFHSSILSWSGVTKPSMRTLETRRESENERHNK